MTAAQGAEDEAPSRIAVAIPHYFGGESPTRGSNMSAEVRAAALSRVITSLHETYGGTRRVFPGYDVPWGPARSITILVVTTGDGANLLDRLEHLRPLFEPVTRLVDPLHLTFECRRVLAERFGEYDEFACIEDDIVMSDPLFFDKLAWFRRHVPPDAVLLPNRFERHQGLKVYVDGPLGEEETERFQDLSAPAVVECGWPGVSVRCSQVENPHSACWFVSAAQMDAWRRHPEFDVPRDDFRVGPLESGMCPAVNGPFRVFKPVLPRPDVLEVEHATHEYLTMWGEGADLSSEALLVSQRNLARDVEELRQRVEVATIRAADAETARDSLLRSRTFRWTAPLRALLRRLRSARSR
jgi:hypothetical protein